MIPNFRRQRRLCHVCLCSLVSQAVVSARNASASRPVAGGAKTADDSRARGRDPDCRCFD